MHHQPAVGIPHSEMLAREIWDPWLASPSRSILVPVQQKAAFDEKTYQVDELRLSEGLGYRARAAHLLVHLGNGPSSVERPRHGTRPPVGGQPHFEGRIVIQKPEAARDKLTVLHQMVDVHLRAFRQYWPPREYALAAVGMAQPIKPPE